MRKRLIIRALLSGLSVLISLFANGQSQSIPLQHVQFRDTLIENRLREFAKVAETNFIHVSINIDSTDGGYVYQFFPIYHYEDVEEFKSLKWGKWNNTVVLFYGKADSKSVFQITDATPLSNLKRYGKKLLSKMVITSPDSKTQQLVGTIHEGPEIRFKILGDREIYYEDKGGVGVRRN